MDDSLVDIGALVFGFVCPYLFLSYKRKIATLKTYIGIDKLVDSQVKVHGYDNSLVHTLIKKDINANKNNLITMVLLIVIYLIILRFNILNIYFLLPVFCLLFIVYCNNMYLYLYKNNFKGIE